MHVYRKKTTPRRLDSLPFCTCVDPKEERKEQIQSNGFVFLALFMLRIRGRTADYSIVSLSEEPCGVAYSPRVDASAPRSWCARLHF
eukprot:m.51551 g.51551  ORF g.51551 m.51551 type:complete len:87 (-) comp12630_c1_seq3:833-1093(-)